jgi:hypothetical protein
MSDPVLPHASPPGVRRHSVVPSEDVPRAKAVHPHPTTARARDVPRTPQANGPAPPKAGRRAVHRSCIRSVRALVLLDDSRRDAPALVDLDPTRLRPRTDIRTALTTRRCTTATPTAACGPPAGLARVLHERRQRIPHLLSVGAAQIDLIGDAVERELNRLLCLPPIDVVDEALNDLLCHGD